MILKANHNLLSKSNVNLSVVYQIKDTIFWKQITTQSGWNNKYDLLFIRSKIQFFESKSQLVWHTLLFFLVVYQIKDTIFWKQITTGCVFVAITVCCLSDQRYNFLKANHNIVWNWMVNSSVVYQIKDTIFWKQITTHFYRSWGRFKLFIRSKIQFFESKSQPFPSMGFSWQCCLSDQRYNFLKANHNMKHKETAEIWVVYQIKDTIFWKQITTKARQFANII